VRYVERKSSFQQSLANAFCDKIACFAWVGPSELPRKDFGGKYALGDLEANHLGVFRAKFRHLKDCHTDC
jgi:hypothetical protein